MAEQERPKLVLKYMTGEEIKAGDRVLYFRNKASIDFVVDDANDPETSWYMDEFGGGIMIADPGVSGATFIPANMLGDTPELEFVSRADKK